MRACGNALAALQTGRELAKLVRIPSPWAKSMYLRLRQKRPLLGRYPGTPGSLSSPRGLELSAASPAPLTPGRGPTSAGRLSARAHWTLFHYDNFVSLEYLCQSQGRAVPRRRRDIIMGSHFPAPATPFSLSPLSFSAPPPCKPLSRPRHQQSTAYLGSSPTNSIHWTLVCESSK